MRVRVPDSGGKVVVQKCRAVLSENSIEATTRRALEHLPRDEVQTVDRVARCRTAADQRSFGPARAGRAAGEVLQLLLAACGRAEAAGVAGTTLFKTTTATISSTATTAAAGGAAGGAAVAEAEGPLESKVRYRGPGSTRVLSQYRTVSEARGMCAH